MNAPCALEAHKRSLANLPYNAAQIAETEPTRNNRHAANATAAQRNSIIPRHGTQGMTAGALLPAQAPLKSASAARETAR